MGLAATAAPVAAVPACTLPASATQVFGPGASASYVPGEGIVEAVVVARGGSGSIDSGWAAPLSEGADISTILSVVPGESLAVSVGRAASGPVGGDSGGLPSGGAGSSYTLDFGDGPVPYTSGAGGGASTILRGPTTLVAAGGGGGGSYGGGVGGAAGPSSTVLVGAGTVYAGADGPTAGSPAAGSGGGGGSTVPGVGGAAVPGYGGLNGLSGVGGVGGAAQNIGLTPGTGGGGGGYAGGGSGGGGGYGGSGGAGSSFSVADYSLSAHIGDGVVSFAAAAPEFVSDDTATIVAGMDGAIPICAAGAPSAAITAVGELPPGIVFKDNGDGSASISGSPGILSAGSYLIELRAENANGSDSQQFTLVIEPGAPDSLVKKSGDAQSALVDTPFAGRLAVAVTDSLGNAVPDTEVTFTIASGSGSFGGSSEVTVRSDGSGRATSPVVTAGRVAGPLTISARAGDARTEFGLNVLAASAVPSPADRPAAGGVLASTGVAPAAPAATALALLVAGVLVLGARLRRRWQ